MYFGSFIFVYRARTNVSRLISHSFHSLSSRRCANNRVVGVSSSMRLLRQISDRSNTIMSDSEFESSSEEDSDDASSSPPKKKFKPNVLHENVAVKVDGKIYHLNRVQLALKSNYFEKLFIEDFAEKNSDVVEIRGLNSDTFSTIIDFMNGKDFKSAVNADNYSALLMGLDYLQMEIDLKPFKSFIDKTSVEKVIELYNLLSVNANYQYLEKKVLKYISTHLIEIIKHDETFILSLPFEQFFRIIRDEGVMWYAFFSKPTVHARQTLSQICSKWIFHDIENRIQHFTAIVNAANHGFYSKRFVISNEKVEPLLDEIKKDTSQERIEKCFQKLLGYHGEINPDVGKFRLGEKTLRKDHIANKIDESKKLSRFLDEGHLSDVTIKAGAKTYKLHRYILDTASAYFSGPIPTSNENSELVIDVDEKTFDLIVDFIYFDKIPDFDSNSRTDVMQILKAAAILKSKLMIEKVCVPWMVKFKETWTSEDLIELLNVTVDNNWQSESWVEEVLRTFICRHSEICEDLFRIWQICEDAGLAKLTSNFLQWMSTVIQEMKYEDLIKKLDLFCEENNAGKYSYLYIDHLAKFIVAPKSDSSVESHFVSISCDFLEDLLASKNFVISDPQKIVDVCSKWIVHDVENRYHLIPRIVFAINRNNSMDLSDFQINTPADLSNCSQQVVNDELWKLLNSNCLLPRDLGSNQITLDFKTRPMFILPKDIDKDTRMPRKVCIVDSELREIVSLNFFLNHCAVSYNRNRATTPSISATLIGDTLFVLCEIHHELNVYAYNFSSKKLNILGSAPRTVYYPMDTLLNCNNQLFWCCDDGRVMKYSIELNRWLKLYSDTEFLNHGPYSSDGKMLLRYHNKNKVLQTFDFEQSSWTHLADLPSYSKLWKARALRLTNLHNGFALSSMPMMEHSMLIFNPNTRSWEEIQLPNNGGMSFSHASEFYTELAPYGEELLCVAKKGIMRLPKASFSFGMWRLKNPVSSESELCGIAGIHYATYTGP